MQKLRPRNELCAHLPGPQTRTTPRSRKTSSGDCCRAESMALATPSTIQQSAKLLDFMKLARRAAASADNCENAAQDQKTISATDSSHIKIARAKKVSERARQDQNGTRFAICRTRIFMQSRSRTRANTHPTEVVFKQKSRKKYKARAKSLVNFQQVRLSHQCLDVSHRTWCSVFMVRDVQT